MKRIRINEYQLGLVFKNAVYRRMLVPGTYWIRFSEDVILYDIDKPFTPFVDLNILLQDKQLAEALDLVEVLDNEIVLHYENGIFKQVLQTGRHAFWKSWMQNKWIRVNLAELEIDHAIDRSILCNRLLVPFVRTYMIENFEKGLYFADGKFVRFLESGTYYFWKNNTNITISKADTRQQQMEINGQEILTKDKAALRINAWAQYQLIDLEKALVDNKEYERQLYIVLQLALREYIAGFSFDEVLEKKDSLAASIRESIGVATANLGVTILGFGIRDIILPGDVKDIMNQVLVAEKKAQANIIMRREETASTRALLNTAKLMEDNAMLWKLKEMEYIEKIADKISNLHVSGNGALVEQLKQIFINK